MDKSNTVDRRQSGFSCAGMHGQLEGGGGSEVRPLVLQWFLHDGVLSMVNENQT
jgi:hypothetical protein